VNGDFELTRTAKLRRSGFCGADGRKRRVSRKPPRQRCTIRDVMARTPLSPTLVHDRADVMHDARRLDTLCVAIAPALEPFAADELARITAETLAEDVAGSAAAALAPILRDAGSLAPAKDRVHESLSDALLDAIPAVAGDMVQARATELAQLALGSWFATLHAALAETRHLSLLDGMYSSESSRDHLHARLREEGVRDGAGCFRAIRDALLASDGPVELPGDMRLEVISRGGDGEPHVSAVRTRESDDSASPALAESGTRRRDGHEAEDSDETKKSSA
jgi:hypothetical protein